MSDDDSSRDDAADSRAGDSLALRHGQHVRHRKGWPRYDSTRSDSEFNGV